MQKETKVNPTMTHQTPPKAVLFDIGGVILLSPLQGILDFERKHGIPEDWVNFAIRYGSPNGFWQRLERGEIKMDTEFFKGFSADLHNQSAWKEYHSSFRTEKRKLRDTVNPTQLGDHTSLKAETVDSEPTNHDRGAQPTSSSQRNAVSKFDDGAGPEPSLSKLAKDTTIGDPISLESEEVAESQETDSTIKISQASSKKGDASAMPKIDGEALFWAMMSASRHSDPYVFPALERLTKLDPRPLIGAISNTVIFPPGHPWRKHEHSSPPGGKNTESFLANPREFFDIYVASAETGMRKPSPEIYELALSRLNEIDKQKGGQGIKPNEVVFLDDIGENCKAARKAGMRTIKVQLGKTWRAVKELENMLGGGVELMDDKTRRSKL